MKKSNCDDEIWTQIYWAGVQMLTLVSSAKMIRTPDKKFRQVVLLAAALCRQSLFFVSFHVSFNHRKPNENSNAASGRCVGKLIDVSYTETPQSCSNICQSIQECLWFTHDSATKGCYSLKDCIPVLDCPTCVSGEVNCPYQKGMLRQITIVNREIKRLFDFLAASDRATVQRKYIFSNFSLSSLNNKTWNFKRL